MPTSTVHTLNDSQFRPFKLPAVGGTLTQIRAFVGHSFAPDDEPVISAFLKYFDQMKGALPDFDWTHAKSAEPTELAGKVLKLVEGNNVFIGICTKKERVVANDKLRSSRFNQTKKIASQTDLEWKTSDWVIQEIGLAIGRKMTPVLLIEVGCRKPGGLQGDVEYIPFERDAPERAFGRLLEMFEALSPRPSTGELASPDPATDISETTEAPPAPHDQVPDHTWDKEKFENAFIWNLVSSDPDRANEIDSAFRDSKLASTAEDTAAWTAVTELWRIRIGEQGSLSRLRENYLQFPRNWEIATTLASGLAALGMHSDSAQTYRDAAELVSSNVIEAERLLRLAAVQYAKGGDSGKTEELLRNQRINLTIRGKISELDYLFRYKEILADTGEDFLELEVLERIVQLEPDDWNARFNLAYKYSTMQMNDMSLYHYCQIPFSQRSAIAWNNLGVAFQQTSLSAKSIEAYKTSAEKGETLAMSNLAYKFMQAGFLKEADEELQRALQIKDFHRNIGEAVSSLKDIPENEDTKLKEAIKKIEPKRQFFNSLARLIHREPGMGLADVA